MKLNQTICRGLQPKEKAYKVFDGLGLYLEVTTSGSKIWKHKFYFQGKEKKMSLGRYPVITISRARELHLDNRRMLADGINPIQAKADIQNSQLAESRMLFRVVALEWYERMKPEWKDRYARNIIHRLNANILPIIGDSPINSLKTVNVLDMLRLIENRGAYEMAKRVRQITSQVFDYAIITDRCDHNPVTALAKAIKTRRVKHYPAIDASELSEFLDKLDRNQTRLYPRTIRAIWLSLLCFARPGEIRRCRWEDISWEEKQWIVPAEFMKHNEKHIIPLSDKTIEILKEQRQETGRCESPWVFPSLKDYNKPLSDGTVNLAIKRMGYKNRMTAHGFRALARTTIRERLKYYPDIIEAQLAHKPSGSLGAAYDRAKFLDERHTMMQDWANFIGCQILT